MKRLTNHTIALFSLFILTAACEDFLEREPLGRFTEENYPEGGLTQYVYGMYSDLRAWGVHAFAFVGITSITSDDADKGSAPSDAPEQLALDNFTVLPSNPLISDFYSSNYTAINKANLVLQQAEAERNNLTEEDYLQSQAEARFVRGYLYFNLVRTFGGVPKVDTVITDEAEFNVPRSTEDEIYAFIEEDLRFAAEHLPASWGEEYIGRPTSGSANGMLAKVYLYQERWAESLERANAVINSGMYDLNTPYQVIFTEPGENSSESVFEIQALYRPGFSFGTQYAEVQGVRGTPNLGWGFNVPSEQLVNAYEEGDPRMDATIIFRGETTPYGEFIPERGENPRYNQKVYTDPRIREQVNAQNGIWVNIRILRFADVVLMAAEAANELGQTADALRYLEMVRARARGLDTNVLPEITEQDPSILRDLIRHERRIELAMEHERFFDLVRWGIAEEVLHAAGKTNFIPGKHERMPIPQSEIDKSNGLLTQNPGY